MSKDEAYGKTTPYATCPICSDIMLTEEYDDHMIHSHNQEQRDTLTRQKKDEGPQGHFYGDVWWKYEADPELDQINPDYWDIISNEAWEGEGCEICREIVQNVEQMDGKYFIYATPEQEQHMTEMFGVAPGPEEATSGYLDPSDPKWTQGTVPHIQEWHQKHPGGKGGGTFGPQSGMTRGEPTRDEWSPGSYLDELGIPWTHKKKLSEIDHAETSEHSTIREGEPGHPLIEYDIFLEDGSYIAIETSPGWHKGGPSEGSFPRVTFDDEYKAEFAKKNGIDFITVDPKQDNVKFINRELVPRLQSLGYDAEEVGAGELTGDIPIPPVKGEEKERLIWCGDCGSLFETKPELTKHFQQTGHSSVGEGTAEKVEDKGDYFDKEIYLDNGYGFNFTTTISYPIDPALPMLIDSKTKEELEKERDELIKTITMAINRAVAEDPQELTDEDIEEIVNYMTAYDRVLPKNLQMIADELTVARDSVVANNANAVVEIEMLLQALNDAEGVAPEDMGVELEDLEDIPDVEKVEEFEKGNPFNQQYIYREKAGYDWDYNVKYREKPILEEQIDVPEGVVPPEGYARQTDEETAYSIVEHLKEGPEAFDSWKEFVEHFQYLADINYLSLLQPPIVSEEFYQTYKPLIDGASRQMTRYPDLKEQSGINQNIPTGKYTTVEPLALDQSQNVPRYPERGKVNTIEQESGGEELAADSHLFQEQEEGGVYLACPKCTGSGGLYDKRNDRWIPCPVCGGTGHGEKQFDWPEDVRDVKSEGRWDRPQIPDPKRAKQLEDCQKIVNEVTDAITKAIEEGELTSMESDTMINYLAEIQDALARENIEEAASIIRKMTELVDRKTATMSEPQAELGEP